MSTQPDQDRAAFKEMRPVKQASISRHVLFCQWCNSNVSQCDCFETWQAALKYERERQAKWQTECQAREPMPRPDDVARVLGEEAAKQVDIIGPIVRKHWKDLPQAFKKELLEAQAEEMHKHYATDTDLKEWLGANLGPTEEPKEPEWVSNAKAYRSRRTRWVRQVSNEATIGVKPTGGLEFNPQKWEGCHWLHFRIHHGSTNDGRRIRQREG